MINTTRISIHTVLLAMDLSIDMSVALSYAINIATTYKTNLLLVHVVESTFDGDTSISSVRSQVELAKSSLETIRESVVRSHNIQTEVIVRYGNVRDHILQVQQESTADLVVLGSGGKIDGAKSLGAIAEAVLRGVPSCALTVGPYVRPCWPIGELKTIIVCTDFSMKSLSALPIAALLAVDFASELLLLHVCDSRHDCSPLSHPKSCIERLREIAEPLAGITKRIELVGKFGPTIENILSLAQDRGAGLIVAGVHEGDLDDGTRLHGIVSRVIREAHCPVLTVTQQPSEDEL